MTIFLHDNDNAIIVLKNYDNVTSDIFLASRHCCIAAKVVALPQKLSHCRKSCRIVAKVVALPQKLSHCRKSCRIVAKVVALLQRLSHCRKSCRIVAKDVALSHCRIIAKVVALSLKFSRGSAVRTSLIVAYETTRWTRS